MRSLGAIVAAALALGCARNAVFELELELPPQPAGPMRFAVVEAREGGAEPGTVELGPLNAACGRPDPAPACADRALDPTCSAVVSVVADGARSGPLDVRVRFCESPRCSVPADASAPELQVTIERAFYEGRYTQARVCADEVPTGAVPVTVERCDVRCREGTAAMYCRADGTHFCEDPAAP